MLLNEIIDSKYRERQTDFTKRRDNPNQLRNKLGDGFYSDVRQKPNDPFQVTKAQRKPFFKAEGNGGLAYAKWIVDNKIAEHNPFAPRIYNIVIFNDPSHTMPDVDFWGDGRDSGRPPLSKKTYKLDMEKLEESDNLTDQECRAIYENMIQEKLSDKDRIIEKIDYKYLAGMMAYHLSRGESTIKNKQLLEILNGIMKLNKDGLFTYDLHDGNYMVRRGKHLPQIVVTDPLS